MKMPVPNIIPGFSEDASAEMVSIAREAMSAGEHGGLAVLAKFPLTPWPAIVQVCWIASDEGEEARKFWEGALEAAEHWEAGSRQSHGGWQ